LRKKNEEREKNSPFEVKVVSAQTSPNKFTFLYICIHLFFFLLFFGKYSIIGLLSSLFLSQLWASFLFTRILIYSGVKFKPKAHVKIYSKDVIEEFAEVSMKWVNGFMNFVKNLLLYKTSLSYWFIVVILIINILSYYLSDLVCFYIGVISFILWARLSKQR